MSKFTLEVEGLEELERDISNFEKRMKKIQEQDKTKTLQRAANIIKKGIQDNAPSPSDVDRSIRIWRAIPLKDDIVTAVDRLGRVWVGPSSDKFYSRYLEFGTTKMPSRPFLQPGINSSKEAALNLIEKEMGKVIEDEFKK